MNRADRREYPFDGEFTVDQVDWKELTMDAVADGLADLVDHGFLIKTSHHTYRMSIDKNAETYKARALFRNVWNLPPAGLAVLIIGTSLPSGRFCFHR